MALFQGEDMVDVTTPDGRTLTLPRSIVPTSMMPQMAVPGVAPSGSGVPAGALPPPPNGAPPTELAPTLPSPDAPTTGATVEEGEPTIKNTAGTGSVTMGEPTVRTERQVAQDDARAAKAKAAYDASPAGKMANAEAQQTNALGAEAQAMYGASDLEAAEQDTVADALHTRNEQLDKLFAARNTEAQAAAQAEEKKAGEVSTLRTKIANTKIDRHADHPILAAIFAGLAGLGSAIKHEKIDTLDILYKAIDRKVAAQEADLDRMAKTYDMTKDELAMLKEQSKSKLQMHNTMIAGETEKAVRQIEELTARSSSEKTKANAQVMIAQLQQRAADKSMDAMRWGLDYDQKTQAEKNQNSRFYSDLGFRQKAHADDMQIDREKIAADLEKALAADRASGNMAEYKERLQAAKDVAEKGMKGVDNDYLYTPEGRTQLDQAKQLEDQAQQLEEAGKTDQMAFNVKGGQQAVALMRQKAAVLRGNARTFGVVQARNAEQAGKMSEKYAAAQSMMDTIDEIKILYDQVGRGYIAKDKGQQALQAKYKLLSVKGKEAWQLGAWDKGSAVLTEGILGRDPTEGWDTGNLANALGIEAGNDPEGFKSRLDAVAQSLDQDVRSQVAKNSNWDGKGDLFTHKTAHQPDQIDQASSTLTQARSGVELQNDADATGTVGKVARKVGYPFSPSAADEAAGAQSPRYPGLSRDQEKPFDTLLQATKSPDPKVRQQAIDELAAKAINSADKRPDFAVPYMQNLREYAPDAYAKARAAMPRGTKTDEVISMDEKLRAGAGVTPTDNLAASVVNSIKPDGTVGDEAGYRELARRASQKDTIARSALMEIVKRSGQAKLPAGSVFRGAQ